MYKRLFYENAKLTAYDKRILKEDVDTVWRLLSFKPTTIPIQLYKDEKREDPEIALVEIVLHGKNRVSRLCELVHRAIPYPLILTCTYENEVCFSSADKRFSEAVRDVVVAEEVRLSDWIDLSGPSAEQAEFLKSLDLTGWSYTNFPAFYNSFVLPLTDKSVYRAVFIKPRCQVQGPTGKAHGVEHHGHYGLSYHNLAVSIINLPVYPFSKPDFFADACNDSKVLYQF